MEPEGASLPSAAVIGAVAMVIALLLGGAVLLRDRAVRDGTTEPDAGLSTPVGGEADGTRSAESCDARADAAALAVEAGLYDYDASDTPADLASKVDLVLTGQLLAARSGSGGQQASVVVKPRRMELGEGSPPNAFGLPVVDVDRVGQTANFIAFLRSNPAAPGGYDVAVDGLWLSCDDQDLAYPVFDHPVGWAEVNSIESIVSRVRDFRRVGQPLDTRIVGDGTSVSRVRLVDNTEFALFLPESFGTDLMLGQDDTVGGVAQVQGQEFALSIDIDFCREDNLFPNDSGLFVTSLLDNSSTDGVLLCRPDEFITMRLHPLPPFEFSLRDFDIIPISFGGDYQAFIRQYGLTRGQCCFEDRGPMWIDGDMIVADGVTGHQIRRLEGDTLVPQWTIDLADLIDSPREWVGDGAFLHGVDESGTVVTSTGFGFLLGVDSATGDRSWSIDLEGHSAEGLARTGGGAWLATTDIGGEGDQTAPKLWRFDGSSGDVLWVAEGEPVSDLQWDRPRDNWRGSRDR